jgi:Bacterial surface proteins containing Ig-like domains
VTVTNPAVPVQSVSLDKTTLDLNVGENATLVATVLPENADDKTVTWTSSNTAVATVDATGKVTAVAAGEAVITVTTTDGGKTATCTVTVTNPAVPVQSVSLDKTTLDLNVGENATLVATVLPENADDKTVTWSSSNTTVATVDATGKVTAVAAGEAVITVTTTDGSKTATCTVKVNDKEANHPGDPIGEGEEEQF